MKRIILLIAIFASFTVNAQTATQPKDTATYVLLGKLPDFEMVYKAILSPGDITPNQAKALAEWVRTIQAIPVKEDKTKSPAKTEGK